MAITPPKVIRETLDKEIKVEKGEILKEIPLPSSTHDYDIYDALLIGALISTWQ